ncbi:MAG: hypothetical protein GX624_11180 [Actinobacteria bacterium]|nr:hypothetical protein [Actinomycetota bacterium]
MLGNAGGGWRTRLALVALGVVCLLGVSIPMAMGADATPTYKLKSYRSRGWDRSFKADVYEEMPKVPRVLVFGGSRGLRMDPATIKKATGLTAFNFAFHNGRPEDAWAVTDWVLDTHPDKPPTVIWCIQATTLADVPMNPGLIVDERLSQAFPKSLINAKMKWAMKQPQRNILSGRRFGYDGMLWWNSYDKKRQQGRTLKRALDMYLDADMLAKAGNRKIPGNTRSKSYFVKTIRLLNAYKIRPLIVIMPYHPRALKAFRAVGWGVKQRWLRTYLSKLQDHLNFRVLNCVNIKTFGGNPNGFYDGAHLTASNSRKLIRYCVRRAPGCFKVPKAPTPTPSPSVSGSPAPAPVAPPAYQPVPEDTSTQADFLE